MRQRGASGLSDAPRQPSVCGTVALSLSSMFRGDAPKHERCTGGAIDVRINGSDLRERR
jgi:hypothetical protein